MRPVDMLALHSLQKETKEQIATLFTRHKGGLEEPLVYYRELVLLAARYVDLNAVKEAAEVVALVPPDYYRRVFVRDVAQDAHLEAAGRKLADAFVAADLVQHHYVSDLPVQKAALA